MAKKAPVKPATKPPAKRKPRAKKPVNNGVPNEVLDYNLKQMQLGTLLRKRANTATGEIELYVLPSKYIAPADIATPVEFPAWLLGGLKALLLVAVGGLGGIWAAGGIDMSPSPGPTVKDCLTVAHAADRVSQIRILREFAGKTFPDEPTAQKWLNDQRIEARKADWIPYTDELGASADIGVDAVKALADKLEGKQ